MQEVKAASDQEPLRALKVGLQISSSCRSLLMDNKVVGMFGVVPDLESFQLGYRVGYIWYLGAADIRKAPKSFMRLSYEWVEKLGEHYDCLCNYVDMRNRDHIAWLRRLGFKFGVIEEKYGAEQRPFIYFWRPTCAYPQHPS